MKKTIFAAAIILTVLGASAIVRSQMPTGGGFTLEKSVVANGGGLSAGDGYSVNGTAGQPITGGSSASGLLLKSGFWQSDLAPTAALVSISGRVLTAEGRGLRNVVITLTNQFGTTLTARSSSFGYYHFDEIESGQTVVLTVGSRLFQYMPQAVFLNDNIAGLDLTPLS